MLGLRERVCFELARRMLSPPPPHSADFTAYQAWREEELAGQWRFFDDADIAGKRVVDFGCGAGQLALYLAQKDPERIIGVELGGEAIAAARAELARSSAPNKHKVEFREGTRDRMPVDDAWADTILAFDCLEHVMAPAEILREWRRALRPGGKVLIWWSPYKSPYGPHLEAVMPLPWAHVVFGERAVLRAARRIYDLPEFAPRPWHKDEGGHKKPNPLAGLETFRQQGYINQLGERDFFALAEREGLPVTRAEPHTFSGGLKRQVGSVMLKVPRLREYFVSFYILECTRA